MGRGLDAILRLAETRHLDIVAMWNDDAPRRPRDLDYGDVEADADHMEWVLEMRSLGHTEECIHSSDPGNEPTPGCAGCQCPHGNTTDCATCAYNDGPYAPGVYRDGGPL